MMNDDEGWMKNDEVWRMNDEGWWFQAVEGFCRQPDRQTNEQMDICECRVAFVSEKVGASNKLCQKIPPIFQQNYASRDSSKLQKDFVICKKK